MNGSEIFNLVLIFCLSWLSSYLLYKRYKAKCAIDSNPQLEAIVKHMNVMLVETLDRMTRSIDDSLENEYGDPMHYLREQAGRHLTNITGFVTWVKSVSDYSGWGTHIASINGDYDNEVDYYKPWTIVVSTSATTNREYAIPQQNVAHLIDCLESMNNYNEKLIEMIKASE